jgi:hypothetical protein
MTNKKNLHRWKVEYFLTEVLNNNDVRELIQQKKLFAAIILIDDLYIYNDKQFKALLDSITY